MKFEVITDAPFSLDGVKEAHYKKGDVFDVEDVDRAEFLIRNEIAMVVEDGAPVKVSDVEAQETPIAIIEADAITSKKNLKKYAQDEHEITLEDDKLVEMKIKFAEKYTAKMDAIEANEV